MPTQQQWDRRTIAPRRPAYQLKKQLAAYEQQTEWQLTDRFHCLFFTCHPNFILVVYDELCHALLCLEWWTAWKNGILKKVKVHEATSTCVTWWKEDSKRSKIWVLSCRGSPRRVPTDYMIWWNTPWTSRWQVLSSICSQLLSLTQSVWTRN